MSQEGLTHERLLELFTYDPTTGVITRRNDIVAGKGSVRFKAGSVAGYKNPRGYIIVEIDHRPYKAHRLAWMFTHGVWPSAQIDHINGDPTDNRISNLREASTSENCRNRSVRSDSRSGLKGVRYRRGKWQTNISVNGKRIWLGTFETAEEAHAAYVAAAQKSHGEFARVA